MDRRVKAGSPTLSGDDSRLLEVSVLKDERVVFRRVIRSSQLHTPIPPLDVRVVHALHLRVDDPVAQVLLAVLPKVLAPGFHLADEEGRGLEIPDPLE